ncbi:MAG: hypothetical protein LH616_18595 [Ilumatobacteraceae bacterium]|nr:hypothetical protein [Ilumatobacteraceae bacterium]
MHAQDVIARPTAPARNLWLHGPLQDTLLGWCFIPVAMVVHFAEPNLALVQTIMAVIFLVSFAHQPLTLGLVYGDPVQRAAHRRLYIWAPLVAAGLIMVGLSISLTLVGLIAGLWNAEHTLMQRYGVLRIYGRKVGDDHGSLEKPMLIVWLVTALAFIGAYVNLEQLVLKLGLDETNAGGVRLLEPLRVPATVLFWVGALASVALAARWWRAERSLGANASRAKHLYALGTLGLVVAVMVDPIAGVAGYVAAHAIEYFAVVHRSLRTRRDDAPVAVVTSTSRRRGGIYILYFVVIAAIVIGTALPFNGRLYAFAILFFGALHILYDGFVWKLRRPNVAASLGITPSA